MKAILKPLLVALLACAVVLGFSGAAGAQEEDPSIADIVAGEEIFSTVGLALELTGLGEMFTDCAGGPYTVLAPTNAAFEATLA